MSRSFVRAVAIGSLVLTFSLGSALPSLALQQDAPATGHEEVWQPLDFFFGIISQLLLPGEQGNGSLTDAPPADEGLIDAGGDSPSTPTGGDSGPGIEPVG
jgi:hypothetical protein